MGNVTGTERKHCVINRALIGLIRKVSNLYGITDSLTFIKRGRKSSIEVRKRRGKGKRSVQFTMKNLPAMNSRD